MSEIFKLKLLPADAGISCVCFFCACALSVIVIRLALLPLFVGICFCHVGKDKSVREAERRDTDEKTGRLPQIEEKHNTKRRISQKNTVCM